MHRAVTLIKVQINSEKESNIKNLPSKSNNIKIENKCIHNHRYEE